jgi:hypothetical protein
VLPADCLLRQLYIGSVPRQYGGPLRLGFSLRYAGAEADPGIQADSTIRHIHIHIGAEVWWPPLGPSLWPAVLTAALLFETVHLWDAGSASLLGCAAMDGAGRGRPPEYASVAGQSLSLLVEQSRVLDSVGS